ncbi:MAG: DNA primase [Bacilli bacterium]|nr:DNA primase [Bacilli bacterium]
MADKKYQIDAKMIVEKSDIVAVISHYLSLEKKGSNYMAVCPFHDDTKPSLTVNREKKWFKCFACNTSGNAIDFVKKYKNVSFLEAVKEVAEISGIDINIRENPETIRKRKYYKIMEEASNVYSLYLGIKDGEKAREYLKNRHIDEDIIKRFKIGLSNNNGDLLVKSLIETNKAIPLDLQELGLVGMDKVNNRYYDLFRSRIMFPLKDLSGNIVGFSGRIYDTVSSSKYMNSQENIIFKKSTLLYNYSDAVNEIKKKDSVILFEGFMDVISAYKAGVYHTVATMGTALTEQHIKTILSLTKNITLCFDGDEAGIKANKRAIALFNKYGVNVKVVMLPEGLDPDDYLNKYGKEKTYNLLVNENISAIDYLYNIAKKNLNTNDSNSIIAFQKSIYRLVDYFKSNALKTYLFGLMSKDLNMSVEDVASDYEHIENLDINIKKENKDIIVDIPEDLAPIDEAEIEYLPDYDFIIEEDIPTPAYKPKVRTDNLTKSRYLTAEEGLIYLSYQDKNDCKYIKTKLGYDEFVDSINRNLLYYMYEYYELHEKMNFDEFVERLNPQELQKFNSIINDPNIFLRESLDDYILVVKKAKYKKGQEDIKKNASMGVLTPEDIEEFAKCKSKTIKIKEKKGK